MTITATPRRARAGRRPAVTPRRALRLGFAASPREPRRAAAALFLAVLLHILILLPLLFVSPRDYERVRPFIDPAALRQTREDEVTFILPIAGAGGVAAAEPNTGLSAPAQSDDLGRGLVTPRVVPNFIPPVEQGTGAGAPAGPPASAAERLRQRVSDPRLWGAPPIASPLPRTPIDVVRERIAADLDAYNDSVAAEAGAAARAKDWTIKGEDGKRWGVSPNGIHLGGVTIPLPGTHGFVPPAGRRDEIEGRMRTDRELADQADRARIRDTFDERARAIRERKDRERADGGNESSN